MDHDDSQRLLGQVQGSLAGLTQNVDRILDNLELMRREMLTHITTDEQQFKMLHDGLGTLRDRLMRVEGIADTVESHGDAILTIEDQIRDLIEAARRKDIEHTINRRWAKSIVGAAGVAGGLVGSNEAPKLWKWVQALFK